MFNDYLRVVRTITPLAREIWRFGYWDFQHTLVLREVSEETRATTRHKFRITRVVGSRKRNQELPPIPPEVRATLLEQFLAALQVEN